MMYDVRPGPCSQSFGVHIATTAGFPPSVINEAKRKAAELEQVNADGNSETAVQRQQQQKQRIAGFFDRSGTAVEGGGVSANQSLSADLQSSFARS